MRVTGVRLRVADSSGPTGRLLAYCSVELDGQLVVHDVRVIRGNDGVPFVSMPAVPMTDRCGNCNGKNPVQDSYCGKCGAELGPAEEVRDESGRPVRFRDVAHPVTREFRDVLAAAVLRAYRAARPCADAYEQFNLGEGANGYAGSWG